MNDADFKKLDFARLNALSHGELAKLLKAMTPQQQKQAVAAFAAAYVSGAAANAKPGTAASPFNEFAAAVYARRRTEGTSIPRG